MPNVFLPAECPRCRMALRVRTEYLGRWVACRYCGELFQAAATAESTAPAAKVYPAPSSSSPAETARGSTHAAAPTPGPVGATSVPADAGSEPDEALEFAAERHRFEVERRRWEETRRAQAEELERARAEATALAATRDALDRALDDARRQQAAAEARVEALAAEAQSPRPPVDPIPPGLLERLADLQTEVETLRDALARARAPRPPDRLPVLCRDLARWATLTPIGPRPIATPVGPAHLPPSLDDLAAVDQQIASLRALLKFAPEPGKAYHTLFDVARFQALQQKLKEAQLLSERLLKQVERSRNQKDLLFHLMLAQRNDEINRRRR